MSNKIKQMIKIKGKFEVNLICVDVTELFFFTRHVKNFDIKRSIRNLQSNFYLRIETLLIKKLLFSFQGPKFQILYEFLILNMIPKQIFLFKSKNKFLSNW